MDLGYIPDLGVFEGQTLSFRVIEVRDGGRSVVLSRKALLADERRLQSESRLSELTPGAIVEGTVQSIQSYGAFIDLGGIEGMIHISELGHGRVSSVGDVLQVGESVQVQVVSVDPATDDKGPRVRLSMKALQNAPESVNGSIGKAREEIAIVDAQVVKVEPFGVFISTDTGPGVIPSRELALPPGGDPRRSYPIGKELRAVSIGNDSSGRARYSERRVEEAEARLNFHAFRQKESQRDAKGENVGSFGALLEAHFKK